MMNECPGCGGKVELTTFNEMWRFECTSWLQDEDSDCNIFSCYEHSIPEAVKSWEVWCSDYNHLRKNFS
jgi:hypothetical protein